MWPGNSVKANLFKMLSTDSPTWELSVEMKVHEAAQALADMCVGQQPAEPAAGSSWKWNHFVKQ